VRRRGFIVNGEEWAPGQRYGQPPLVAPSPPIRIFDNLDSAPREVDRFFSKVARRMRSEAWWWSQPRGDEAGQVWSRGRDRLVLSGEIVGGEINH